jgi:RNA polymerase sigma factor (sigma-70 family)
MPCRTSPEARGLRTVCCRGSRALVTPQLGSRIGEDVLRNGVRFVVGCGGNVLQRYWGLMRVWGMELMLGMSQRSDAVFETVPMVTFETLYRREYPGLIAVAWALSGSREDGEDLVHDTMLRALIGWKRVGALQRPGGWCHRVLMNRCRSWWRRSRTASAFLASQHGRLPYSTGPSEEAVSFWTAVRTLPLRQRSVVALYYAGELLVTEIAEVLEIPEGTVRSDLSRSRPVLAAAMGGSSV